MKIEILGCDGGFANGYRTTSALIDGTVLLDAGTGVGSLNYRQMNKIQSVLLTHSHLDHVVGLCFAIDHRLENLKEPTAIYCLKHTADMIRSNLINGRLWPDIENIRINGINLLEFNEIKPYSEIKVGHCRFTPLPVDHVVPTVGYALHGTKSTFVYVSDMYDADERMWKWINSRTDISHIVMECAFPSRMEKIAEVSKHLTPRLLKQRLERFKPKGRRPKIYVSHLKPNHFSEIRRELDKIFPDGSVMLLEAGMKFRI